MESHTKQHALAALAALLLSVGQAPALINTSFTPVDLTKKAESIVVCDVTADADEQLLTIAVTRVLKGEATAIASVDAAAMSDEDEKLSAMMEEGRFPAIIFGGDFSQAGGGKQSAAAAAIHTRAGWFGIEKRDEGYVLTEDAFDLKAVWDGGSLQLARAVEYVLNSRAADIPAIPGVEWESSSVIGRVPVGGGAPSIALADDGYDVFYPSTNGDVVVHLRGGKAVVEPLGTASFIGTRLDITGDGSADWIGYDGSRLYTTAPAGTVVLFEIPGVHHLLPATLGGEATLVAVTDSGATGLRKSPTGFRAEPLTAGTLSGIRDGKVFDATGDGRPDLVLIAAKDLLVAPGLADGSFGAAASVCRLFDLGLQQSAVADFDGDGCLDILLAGSSRYGVELLVGDGKGGFTSGIEESGEMNYHAQRSLRYLSVGDINNDGLLDVALTPRTGPPMVMFNRGFGTFGFARGLDLAVFQANTEGAAKLSDAGSSLMVDLDGDGAQDLLCNADGRLVAVMREAGKRVLGLTVGVDEGQAGPVAVSVSVSGRTVGGAVLDDASVVLFGKTAKGPLDVSWVLPDGSSGKKRIVILKPATLKIGR